jgi:DNA-damage-inducible protein D
MWLAGLGKQAIDEVVDPELGIERLHELYEAKGYSQKWIGNRLKTIDVRKELTKEWQKRGVQNNKDYGILTATIAKGTFGLTPSEHAKHKGLGKENLRDHMTNMELILTAFSEEATRMLAEKDDAQGFEQNHEAAARGGEIAGKARKNLETATGQKVVSAKNYLTTTESNNADSLPENSPPQ